MKSGIADTGRGGNFLAANALKLESQGLKIHVNSWVPSNEKAIIQLAHGMAEHSKRYHDFSCAMSDNGIAVYANDHRGHGQTASPQGLGFISGQDGWKSMIEDMYALNRHIIKRHSGCPVFLMGHSMGSLLALEYAARRGHGLRGILLSGVSSYQPVLSFLGLVISWSQARLKGRKTKSLFLNNLLFGGYNKYFKPSRTDFDWLCSDKKVVDSYLEDDLCGNVSSAGFFYDLAKASLHIYNPRNLKNLPDIPFKILCGKQDPVGTMGRGAQGLYLILKKAGIRDICFNLYKGCRHEVLNEKIKDTVYRDIITWVANNI